MRRRVFKAGVLAAALAATAALPALAAGETRGANPCPTHDTYPWMGDSFARSVAFRSLKQPNGISSYRGTILRPRDRSAYPGTRPLVVLQHGLGGNQCGLWWAAQDLAGHGYVTLVWTAPYGSGGQAIANALDATRSAIAFARSKASPFLGLTDRNRVSVAGHSLGSIVTSRVQADPGSGIVAAVAFDTLHRWMYGDPGAAESSCARERAGEVTPTVPALGFAKDEPCSARPSYDPADLKEQGFLDWRAHGVPSMELVMRGFDHGDFATRGTEKQEHQLAYYVQAWLSRWVMGRTGAADKLVAPTILGNPVTDVLSRRLLSGAFLPHTANTTNFRGWLTHR